MTATNTTRLNEVLKALGQVATQLDQSTKRLNEQFDGGLSRFETHLLTIAMNEITRCMDQCADEITSLEIATAWARS